MDRFVQSIHGRAVSFSVGRAPLRTLIRHLWRVPFPAHFPPHLSTATHPRSDHRAPLVSSAVFRRNRGQW